MNITTYHSSYSSGRWKHLPGSLRIKTVPFRLIDRSCFLLHFNDFSFLPIQFILSFFEYRLESEQFQQDVWAGQNHSGSVFSKYRLLASSICFAIDDTLRLRSRGSPWNPCWATPKPPLRSSRSGLRPEGLQPQIVPRCNKSRLCQWTVSGEICCLR